MYVEYADPKTLFSSKTLTDFFLIEKLLLLPFWRKRPNGRWCTVLYCTLYICDDLGGVIPVIIYNKPSSSGWVRVCELSRIAKGSERVYPTTITKQTITTI